jgi:hypothetical protein
VKIQTLATRKETTTKLVNQGIRAGGAGTRVVVSLWFPAQLRRGHRNRWIEKCIRRTKRKMHSPRNRQLLYSTRVSCGAEAIWFNL